MNMRVVNTGICLTLALVLFVFVAAFLSMGLGIKVSHQVVAIVVFGGAIISISLLGIAVVGEIISERAENGSRVKGGK